MTLITRLHFADIARNIHFNTMEEEAEASLSLTLKIRYYATERMLSL